MKISEHRLRSIIRGIIKESINSNTTRRSLRESDEMMSDEYSGDYDESAYDDAYIPSDSIEDEEITSAYGVPVEDSELTGVEPLPDDAYDSSEYVDDEYGDYEDFEMDNEDF